MGFFQVMWMPTFLSQLAFNYFTLTVKVKHSALCLWTMRILLIGNRIVKSKNLKENSITVDIMFPLCSMHMQAVSEGLPVEQGIIRNFIVSLRSTLTLTDIVHHCIACNQHNRKGNNNCREILGLLQGATS